MCIRAKDWEGVALSLVIAIMSVMHARIGQKKGEFCN